MKPQLTFIMLAALGLAAVAVIPFARHQAALAAEVEARAEAHAATAIREREQAALLRDRRISDPMESMIKTLPEAERVKITEQLAAQRERELDLAEAKTKAAQAKAAAEEKQKRLVKLAHEAADLATKIGIAEVSGNPVLPTDAARLKELQALFKDEARPEIAALITARNGSGITRLVEGW